MAMSAVAALTALGVCETRMSKGGDVFSKFLEI